jgi:DNA helicase II / ATP-dependent DNA helicase PcrA
MFSTLSETQKKVVFEKKGKFVVRACPGSGKTYSVAARLANEMANWKLNHQGISAISFTNVAWQEIEKQVTTHFNLTKPIPYPHFLGTIDSFVNRFMFLPFGHLIMECTDRPVLVGEPHGTWSGKRFADSLFTNLTYDINGNICPINKRAMPSNWENNRYIIPSKNRLIKAGYANQNDANYFAMKVLEAYPNIAKAIVHRFPLFMVDEAQDTSEVQMRIIDILINNGLENIMLVGDPDQAIFEWHGGKPKLFIEKYNAWEENSILLNENRRSSQNICNCTCRLSSLEGTSIAINETVKDCSFIPVIRIYDRNNPDNLLNDFKKLCSDFDIDLTPENVAIIFRSNDLFNAITGIKEIGFNNLPWDIECSYTKDFARGKYIFCYGDFKSGFQLLEKAIVKGLSGSSYCSKSELEHVIELNGFIKFRKEVYKILELLPNTNLSIGEWINETNKTFKENDIVIDLKIKNSKGYLSFDQLFGIENEDIAKNEYYIGTIHSIKGETFEAVLVILKTKGVGSLYKTMIKNKVKIFEEEELRIVYVGITRPRRLLVLAVPDEENKKAWESALFSN